jgi:plasmid maintenance system antidote protein VapI
MRNTRQETKDAIKFLEIPKTKLARMVGLEASRISEYVRDKSLPAATTEKIESAVRDIVKVWTILPVRVDLSDLEGFARAIQIADDIVRGEQRLENEQIAAETSELVRQIEQVPLFSK